MSTILTAAVMLIALPIAFNAAFAALARRVDYPDILRRPTAEVLGRFRAGGSSLVLLWWGFAMTALLLAPAAVLLAASLPGVDPAVSALGVVTGVLAALVQCLGLIRWTFLVPYLARASADATAERAEAIELVFQSFHRFLGVAVGEHLGYLLSGAWTVLVGVGVLQSGIVPWWLGALGIVIGGVLALCAFEFVGAFEPNGWRLAGAVTPIAYIAWSLWLAGMGVALLFAAA